MYIERVHLFMVRKIWSFIIIERTCKYKITLRHRHIVTIDASKTKCIYPLCCGAICEGKENPTARASLSTEMRTLQRKIERLDNKVNLFAFTMMWNLVI